MVKQKTKTPIKSANAQLFFKLNNATNTEELIKIIKTIEFIDKVDLNTLAIHCIASPGATIRSSLAGLPDDAFLHDGQLTKRETRRLEREQQEARAAGRDLGLEVGEVDVAAAAVCAGYAATSRCTTST